MQKIILLLTILLQLTDNQEFPEPNEGFGMPIRQAIQIPKDDRLIYPPPQQRCRCKKIDTGSYQTEYAWNSSHPMVTGSGSRYVQKWIYFDENFTQTPKVELSLGQIDSSKNVNLRVNCRALSINQNRFLLRIYTWADTKLYSARCIYIAQGY